MIGIYKIENLINHHVYIGQSVNIHKRWSVHRRVYLDSTDSTYNYPLYRAFRKHGLENFSFEILEECDREELDNKEIYYIKLYNSFINGYNQTTGGSGIKKPNESKQVVLGIINDLATTEMLQREIAEKWGVDISTVNAINTGRSWNHNRQYPIQSSVLYMKKLGKISTGKKRDDWKCCDCGKLISVGSKRCVKCNDLYRISKRPEHIPDRKTLKCLIRNKSFTSIGRQFGVSDNAIRKWCDKYNLPRKAKDIKAYSNEEWDLI